MLLFLNSLDSRQILRVHDTVGRRASLRLICVKTLPPCVKPLLSARPILCDHSPFLCRTTLLLQPVLCRDTCFVSVLLPSLSVSHSAHQDTRCTPVPAKYAFSQLLKLEIVNRQASNTAHQFGIRRVLPFFLCETTIFHSQTQTFLSEHTLLSEPERGKCCVEARYRACPDAKQNSSCIANRYFLCEHPLFME